MPNVLVLSSELPPGPGGIGTHAYQVALGLDRCGWRVTLAGPQELASTEEIAAFNAKLPFEIKRLRQFGGPASKLAYRLAVVSRLVRRVRPDVILASGERMVWLAAMLSPALRVPFVAVGHAMELNVPRAWHRAANRHAFERAAAIISVSRYTESRMHELGIRTPRSIVIHNGADETRFGLRDEAVVNAFKKRYGLETGRLLVTVGSIHERKGQDVVIRALPRVLAVHPDVHYVAIGMPYKRDEFLAIARSLGVDDRVHFLGVLPHEEVVQALNAATLFVMTSQHTSNGDFEGFGIAVVEAALCGLAAVVSDNSGVTEAIEPGETGLVAQLSDPVSTADQINALLSDPERLERMSRLARERASSGKTWSVRATEYDRALRDLLDTRS